MLKRARPRFYSRPQGNQALDHHPRRHRGLDLRAGCNRTAGGLLLVASQIHSGADHLFILLFLASTYVAWGADCG